MRDWIPVGETRVTGRQRLPRRLVPFPLHETLQPLNAPRINFLTDPLKNGASDEEDCFLPPSDRGAMVSEARIGDVPDDCHPHVRTLFEYWKSIHPATGIPGRQHFDPVDIPLLLPNILMVDAPTDTVSYTFRLIGTRLVEFFGEDFTGQPFINAYVKAEESRAFKDLCDLFGDRQPRWRRGLASFVRNREYTVVERLYVPLAADSEHVGGYRAWRDVGPTRRRGIPLVLSRQIAAEISGPNLAARTKGEANAQNAPRRSR